MIFYHGTTTNIKVNKVLLPPNETGVLYLEKILEKLYKIRFLLLSLSLLLLNMLKKLLNNLAKKQLFM